LAAHSQGFVIPPLDPDKARGFDWEKERWGEPVLVLDYRAAYSGDMLQVKLIRTDQNHLMHYKEIWPERRSDIKRVLDSREEVLAITRDAIKNMQDAIKTLKK
jgi:hypothetical protein